MSSTYRTTTQGVTMHDDPELGVLCFERGVEFLRGGLVVARGVLREPMCPNGGFLPLPDLVRVAEVLDAAFERDLQATYEVRSGRGRGQELRMAGWRAAPVVLRTGHGREVEVHLLPPFLIKAPIAQTDFLVESTASGRLNDVRQISSPARCAPEDEREASLQDAKGR
jgi:hypothetical protein